MLVYAIKSFGRGILDGRVIHTLHVLYYFRKKNEEANGKTLTKLAVSLKMDRLVFRSDLKKKNSNVVTFDRKRQVEIIVGAHQIYFRHVMILTAFCSFPLLQQGVTVLINLIHQLTRGFG